jgi:hypothetical protein
LVCEKIVTLRWGDTDVEMELAPIPTGWKHRVVWKNQFCLADETCHFQFKATSGVQGDSSTSGWKNFGYFDACIDDFPVPQM